MKCYSIIELFRLSRARLCALHTETLAILAALPADADQRLAPLENLRRIRRVLAMPSPER